MKSLWSAILFLLSVELQAAPTQCFGPKNAATRLIYLHGIDDENFSASEKENRRILEKLASSLKLRIALVRGNHRCDGKVCWQHGSPDHVVTTYAKVRKEAAACFDTRANFGLLGFSNGGYLAGKIVFQCPQPQPAWVIAVGSAGVVKPPRNLAKCAPITVLMGDKDITLAKARRFYQELARNGARARFETFKGGHEFKEPVLRTFLSAPLPPRKGRP